VFFMVHVHGRVVLERAAVGVVPQQRIAVPVDVGKHTAMAMVADFAGERLVAPFVFSMDRPGIAELVRRVERVVAERGASRVDVGVEAAGHYHRPLTASVLLPAEWELVELNPAHVTAQRRVLGKRGVKTDQVDLVAMYDLLVAGRGQRTGRRDAALLQLQAWTAMRFRRVTAVIAAKNQLLGQMDRAFPGAGTCVWGSLLDTKIGRLVVAEFPDPDRLARLGVERFRRFATARDVIVARKVAERFVAAAKAAVPLEGADTARRLLAADLALLQTLERHVAEAEAELARILPATPFQILTTTPGWALVRAARYGAALGDPARWPTARQVYRAAGLTPSVYESAGKRVDGNISREGSVELRGALLELGKGLWLCDPATRPAVAALRARGKPAGVIACALANRANRIAFAMVRDQVAYDPDRWRS
jgi:transposase